MDDSNMSKNYALEVLKRNYVTISIFIFCVDTPRKVLSKRSMKDMVEFGESLTHRFIFLV